MVPISTLSSSVSVLATEIEPNNTVSGASKRDQGAFGIPLLPSKLKSPPSTTSWVACGVTLFASRLVLSCASERMVLESLLVVPSEDVPTKRLVGSKSHIPALPSPAQRADGAAFYINLIPRGLNHPAVTAFGPPLAFRVPATVVSRSAFETSDHTTWVPPLPF